MKLTRFGVSMEVDLLRQFDHLIEKKGYSNRSEAFRDLARRSLIERECADPASFSIGVIAFTYDHARHELQHHLTHIGHSKMGRIISSMHVHLDEHNCLEIVVAKGTVEELRDLADRVTATKGVQNGELFLAPLPRPES